MRMLFFILLLLLLLGCDCPNTRLASPHKRIHSGNELIIHANGSDIMNAPQKLQTIEVTHNGKASLSISYFATNTTIVIFENGNAQKIVTYDIRGKKIAECLIKDDRPYSGTIYHLVLGLRGVKESVLLTYQNGEMIEENEYNIIEVNNLQNQQ